MAQELRGASSCTAPPGPNTAGSKWTYASGEFSCGASRKLSTLRIEDCITAVPIFPMDAPMMPVGFRANEFVPQGRDPQSIAFFSAPGIDRLYSGDTNRMPSADSTASFRARASGG
ncbi:hypothetical protein CHMI_01428 [Cellulomonas hominis]|nr:hypothetical protein CHMI_01428 [Cellulomonas hominis]